MKVYSVIAYDHYETPAERWPMSHWTDEKDAERVLAMYKAGTEGDYSYGMETIEVDVHDPHTISWLVEIDAQAGGIRRVIPAMPQPERIDDHFNLHRGTRGIVVTARSRYEATSRALHWHEREPLPAEAFARKKHYDRNQLVRQMIDTWGVWFGAERRLNNGWDFWLGDPARDDMYRRAQELAQARVREIAAEVFPHNVEGALRATRYLASRNESGWDRDYFEVRAEGIGEKGAWS